MLLNTRVVLSLKPFELKTITLEVYKVDILVPGSLLSSLVLNNISFCFCPNCRT